MPGEGGVLTAYQHAQLMAGIELAPATGAKITPAVVPTLATTLVSTAVPALAPTAVPTSAPTVAPTAAAVPQPVRIELAISDDAFTPKNLSVPVGATVVWNRTGTHPHTATADDNSFDSGILRAGQSFEHTFTQPGTYPYYCDVHGGPGSVGMSGSVTVQ